MRRIRTVPILMLAAALGLGLATPAQAAQEADPGWPQGPGPNGDWSATGPAPPLRFSVRSGANVVWKTALPETGQGGIAIAGRRAFVATMAPWGEAETLTPEDRERYAHAIEKREVAGREIDAHCVDLETGAILWTRRITAVVPSIYTYPFSDATSASPVADADHVWFTHAGGRVVCFTHAGEIVWEHTFPATYDGPFNKQFEPFLVRDGERTVLVLMVAFAPPGRDEDALTVAERLAGRWHHLVGLDASDGRFLWRSDDALTHYNAPTLVQTSDGPAALIARGGPHDVPERPVGVSLVRLTGSQRGTSVWRYEDPHGNHEGALQTMAHDDRRAYWMLKDPRNLLVVLDLATGKPLREISLTEGVTRTAYEPESRRLVTEAGVDLERGVFPARYSMIAANGRLYFQCYATAWGKPTIGPTYSFGCVDPGTGLVQYQEVPTDAVVEDGVEALLWRTPRVARPVNSRGEDVTGDDRSRWDGWDWVFNGTPTRVNDRLYFTLASGVVYVLDGSAPVFDTRALLAVNDLGPAGGTWTANSVSYAAGRLYHRTGSQLVCIGRR